MEVGYEQISTTLIAKMANVSRGALTHQFPTRNDLLLAAFEGLLEGWHHQYAFTLDPEGKHLSTDELIDALWDNIFDEARYVAAIELMLAARQDNELGRGLRDILEAWKLVRDGAIVRLIGGDVGDDEAELRIQLHLAVLRGIAMHKSFDSDPETAQKLIGLWKNFARNG
jgi:AcrR family transcriptional regulator